MVEHVFHARITTTHRVANHHQIRLGLKLNWVKTFNDLDALRL
ncbi:Uncharacterised protein [Vibrio cholerae]|nr:Uncharacterised protein [Vibrio cholerae]CSI84198.1 Uncharacterised protein [Vibrio cholerae]